MNNKLPIPTSHAPQPTSRGLSAGSIDRRWIPRTSRGTLVAVRGTLKSAYEGFSLIEVLISLMLLSLMLLGLDAMGVYALHENQKTWNTLVAVNQLHSMIERIHASQNNAEVMQHFAIWNKQNNQLHLQGSIKGDYANYTINICWELNCLQQTLT